MFQQFAEPAPEACGTLLASERSMLSIREKYWHYSLFVLIVGLGVTIFVELTPFLGGLLGAVTIYVLRGGRCGS